MTAPKEWALPFQGGWVGSLILNSIRNKHLLPKLEPRVKGCVQHPKVKVQ